MKCTNRYFKFFGSNGQEICIKFSRHLRLKPKRGSRVMIRWESVGSGERMYHVPEHKFRSEIEIASYIVQNISSNTPIKFKVINFTNGGTNA